MNISRAATTRSIQQRPILADSKGRLHIDEKLIPPGMELRWVRESTQGMEDPENVTSRLEDSWAPIERDKMPTLAPPMLPGHKPVDNFIRRGGLILMGRAKELCDEERAAYHEYNESVLKSLDKDRQASADGKYSRAEGEIKVSHEKSSKFRD